MKRLAFIGSTLLIAAIALQAPLLRGAHAAATEVGVSGITFSPASVTIAVGDTVHFSWSGVTPHNVVFEDNASETSGGFSTSGDYSRTFNSAGSYAYYCEVHGGPGGQGMSGTVTVQQAQATNTPQAQATNTRTRTPTRTPEATTTGTPQPSATAAAATNTPVPVADLQPPATNTPSGGAGPTLISPNTGGGPDGGSGGFAPVWASVAMAIAGLVLLGGAMVVRRRSR